MKLKAILRVSVFVLIYSFPLVIFETYFLATKREFMNGDEYLYPLFAFMENIDDQYKSGLQRSNIKKHSPHQFLFEYNKESKVRYSKFETDRYGTIKPSDMENGIASGKIDTIFCGGSTTEASLVWEGQRPPDIFSRITGTSSVNAGRSGKDIYGCTKTIDYLMGKFAENGLAKPSNIIIATNVNTLSNFGWTKFNRNKAETIKIILNSPEEEDKKNLGDNVNKKRSFSLKTLSRRILPGSYYVAYSFKKTFFNNKRFE